VDEHRAGFGNEIAVRIRADGVAEVEDSGRGIPTSTHEESGMPVPVFLMTKAFAGAKFDEGAYSFSGGLHGVGLKCINAFSEWVELVCRRGGRAVEFRFVDGVFDKSREVDGGADGTLIRFLPKYDVFGVGGFDHDRVAGRLEDASYLNPGLKCTLSSGMDTEEFYSENGVAGLLESKGCTDIFVAKAEGEGVQVDCCLGTLPHGDTVSISYANGIPTPEGGSHVAGVKGGIARVVSSYAARRGLVKDSDPAIGGADVAEGALLVVSIRMDAPPFSSQKKTKLISQELELLVAASISQFFGEWLEASPARAKHIVGRMLMAAKNREKLKSLKARLRLISQTRRLRKPSSVLSAGTKTDEIMISVKDPNWRGLAGEDFDILPMRLSQSPHTGRTSLEKLLKNEDYFSLAAVLGGGVGSPEDDPEGGFSLEKCRYKKITLRCGGGAAAAMAGSFVIIFMEKHLPGLIESGLVFWVDPTTGDSFRLSSSQSLKSEVGAVEADSPETGGDADTEPAVEE
jgi:DNA gyrase subunit B